MSSTAASFAPIATATGAPVQLAMQRLLLTGQVLPAGARLTVQHVFRCDEKQPLEVIYSFPLPRDAALRRFRITGEGFEAHSELKETAEAVKFYERGILRGSLSTLARQYGDGVVNLTVGNLRPQETVTVWLEILAGVELSDDGFRFRFPFTLAPNYHPGAKAALVAPGEIERELPADEFGDVIMPRFRQDTSALHQIGFDLTLGGERGFEEIGSPSHTVRVKQEAGRGAQVALAVGNDVPNRDLVLDGRYPTAAARTPQIFAGRDQEGVGRFAVLIPSTAFGENTDAPRRVVILLDRSGSMAGDPISQARKAIEACLSVLSDTDSFGLVAFDNEADVFHPTLQSATREARDNARSFLQRVDARGGTELAAGVLAAAKLLENGSGDIVIMTDGQVSGTEKILDTARSAGVRLHCLGIGSASQDRFLTLLARETGGVSRFVTPRERVDLSAVDLFASIGRPIASGVTGSDKIQPPPPSLVFSGTPLLLFGEGEGPVHLTWDGGQLDLPVTFSDGRLGETVWLLQGSRLITDWESRYASSEALAPLEKRKSSRVAMRLAELSRTYGLASREMSLVAVVERSGDRAGELPESRVVPVGMPEGKDATSLLDAVLLGASLMPMSAPQVMSPARMVAALPPDDLMAAGLPSQDLMAPAPRRSRLFDSLFSSRGGAPEGMAAKVPQRQGSQPPVPEDILLDLAAQMESDGGMPGKTADIRAGATLTALLAFLAQGHTPSSGAFRSHVTRLVTFLRSLSGLPEKHQRVTAEVLEKAGKGEALPGDWLTLAQKTGDPWKALERL